MADKVPTDNGTCKAHSGCMSDIKHLNDSDGLQWKEINSMKKWLISTLVSSIFSLFGIIAMLGMKLLGG